MVVPGGGSATLHITDTYTHATGTLVVTKTIDGPAAGSQGEVKISVTCGGTALADFVIPAGHAEPSSQTYSGIAAGSTCTVEEIDRWIKQHGFGRHCRGRSDSPDRGR